MRIWPQTFRPAPVMKRSGWKPVGAVRSLSVFALVALCGGCATVIRGTTDQVGFNSTPSGAEVHTSNGLGCVTPCTLTIKKNEEFIATFEKQGFVPQQISVTRQVVSAGVAATAGNIVLGGVMGLGVDAATGAGFEHTPNPVNAVLVPEAPPTPPGHVARKPGAAAPAAAPAQPPKS
jgi:hypothetical protein